MRLASLTCSNTELLDALGVLPRLVAVDSHSDTPGLEGAVRLGPDLNIDVARLVAARPDLVVASLSVPGMERVVAAVQAAGLNTLVLDPVSLEDVYRDLHTLGAALGLEARAQQQAAAMRAELRRLAAGVPARPSPLRVAVEWWPRPVIVAGGQSWVTELLRELGAVNAFGERPARSTPVTLAELAAARVDLQVVSWCGVRKLRPELAERRQLAARVIAVPESGLGRPGPRLLEGARALARALGPTVTPAG